VLRFAGSVGLGRSDSTYNFLICSLSSGDWIFQLFLHGAKEAALNSECVIPAWSIPVAADDVLGLGKLELDWEDEALSLDDLESLRSAFGQQQVPDAKRTKIAARVRLPFLRVPASVDAGSSVPRGTELFRGAFPGEPVQARGKGSGKGGSKKSGKTTSPDGLPADVLALLGLAGIQAKQKASADASAAESGAGEAAATENAVVPPRGAGKKGSNGGPKATHLLS
jgi:hypothetical protein